MKTSLTAETLRQAGGGPPLVMVTAYDVMSAHLAEAAGVDLILVGDSAGMVMLGYEDTSAVTMEEMLLFCQAVARGAQHTLLIGDLPARSYESGDAVAVANAERLVREGRMQAVKLEGAGAMLPRVRAVTAAGIPVMGHLGLLPQSVHSPGGYRAQARTASEAQALLDDAQALEEAGAVALVLEAIPPEVAAAATELLTIPTIGIGAGPLTDGQVLVWHDLLGITPPPHPRFVRQYASLASDITGALSRYASDVRARAFPAVEHEYGMAEAEKEAFERMLRERRRTD